MTKLKAWKMASAVFLLSAVTAIAAPAQIFTTLVGFEAGNGANPYDTFIQGADGNLYATTLFGGGKCNCGTVIQMNPAGGVDNARGFDLADGANPYASLVQGADGSFYGTTSVGANNLDTGGGNFGTVFKMRAGVLTTLHSFNNSDGNYLIAGLVLGFDGNYYGTTGGGGDPTCQCGTVYKITPLGELTTLHTFLRT